MERKSKIVKKNDIDYSKVIVLHGINIDPKQFELEKNKFKQQYAADLQSGKLDELKVNQIIHNMFVQRAAVGQVVTDLQNNFDVNFDETEFAELKENLIQNNPEMVNAVESGKAPKDLIEQFAKRIIYETLLWEYLAKEWGIAPTEEEINTILQDHYEKTNQSIREYMIPGVKRDQYYGNVQMQKVIKEIANKFKIEMRTDITKGGNSTSNLN